MIPRLSTLVALLGLTATAHAQLFTPVGQNTGVTANFTFNVDASLNQVSLVIDNSVAGPGGVTGTITSFGFNVPDSLIASASLVSQTWLILSDGRTEPSDWALIKPYDLSAGGGIFGQDIGQTAATNPAAHPNPNGANANTRGIWFGEQVSFVYQFSDFADAAGFLGANGVTARWQQVTEDPGSDQGFGQPPIDAPPFTPVPEPSTYGAIGASLLGLCVLLRRRGSKALPVSSASESPAA